MPNARYFVPDHPKLTDVYTRDELRLLLQKGELSRSDMICDDETGLAHFLGDFLSTPYPEATVLPTRSTNSSVPAPLPHTNEFRASTPLSKSEPLKESDADWEEDDDDDQDDLEDDDDYPDEESEYADSDQLPHNLQQQDTEDESDDLTDEDASFEEELESPDQFQPALSLLAEEEALLYEGHPSWFAYPKTLLGFTFCALAAAFCWNQHYGLEWLTLFGSAAGLFLLYIGLERTTTTYFVSQKRVEMEFGIIGRSTKEIRIEDIRAIDVQQTGIPAILGLGTVSFDSSAGAAPEVVFKNVRGPHRIKELVRSLQS